MKDVTVINLGEYNNPTNKNIVGYIFIIFLLTPIIMFKNEYFSSKSAVKAF